MNVWRAAFLTEVQRYAEESGDRILSSVYFGGGTPSLMEPTLVADTIEAIRAAWPSVNDLEITLEANPGSVETGRFKAYREAGVNRVSIGVQALDDAALRLLGRMHSQTDAIRALEVARNIFERVSFDLIYARQFQTLDAWKDELSRALAFGTDHLSLYQLTVEDGTVFAARAKAGKLSGLPSEDLGADMFDLTQQMTADAGLSGYEVSNHARPGSESRHNMIYWRGGDYIGIGPGAHGRLTNKSGRAAIENEKAPRLWIERVLKFGCGETSRELLRAEEMALEYLLMSLRTSEGLDLSRYQKISGASLSDQKISHLCALGLVVIEGGYLKATNAGRPLLNGILRDLCA